MVIFSSVHRQRSNWNNTGPHLYLSTKGQLHHLR